MFMNMHLVSISVMQNLEEPAYFIHVCEDNRVEGLI